MSLQTSNACAVESTACAAEGVVVVLDGFTSKSLSRSLSHPSDPLAMTRPMQKPRERLCDQPALFEFGTGFLPPETHAQKGAGDDVSKQGESPIRVWNGRIRIEGVCPCVPTEFGCVWGVMSVHSPIALACYCGPNICESRPGTHPCRWQHRRERFLTNSVNEKCRKASSESESPYLTYWQIRSGYGEPRRAFR